MPLPATFRACLTDTELLTLLDDGVASKGPARAALIEHLDHCPHCQELVHLADIAKAAGSAPGEPVARHAPGELVGTQVGRYLLEAVLGAGGMGWVFRAFDATVGRHVALKMLRPDIVDKQGRLAARLVRESQLLARLNHPNIIRFFDIIETSDRLFVAMEFIDGGTLSSYLRRAPRGHRDILELFCEAGRGLAAAHTAGMIHRDFKPDNVLVTGAQGSRRVIVSDFGVALTVEEPASPTPLPSFSASRMTQTGIIPGTPAYMAPEQLLGESVNEKADVFAFAVALWEALFGTRPFVGNNAAQLLTSMHAPLHLNNGRDPQGHRVPWRIHAALRQALQFEPALRPSMSQLLGALAPRQWPTYAAAGLVGTAALSGIVVVLTQAARPNALPPPPCQLTPHGLHAGWLDAPLVRTQVRLLGHLAAATANSNISIANELDQNTRAWLTTSQALCATQPNAPLAPARLQCLQSRELELMYASTMALRGGFEQHRFPGTIATYMLDPATCAQPTPSLAMPRVPVDRGTWPVVAQLRLQLTQFEEQRIAGDIQGALVGMHGLEAQARNTWPRVYVEILYGLGSTYAVAENNLQAQLWLRRAASLAEQHHVDEIAMLAWLALGETYADERGGYRRGLEYADYADAAFRRLGNPSYLEPLLAYARGVTHLYAGQDGSAKPFLEAATHGERERHQAWQALGYWAERRGDIELALAYDRKAFAGRPADVNDPIFYFSYADHLALAGQFDAALAQATQGLTASEASHDARSEAKWQNQLAYARILALAGRPTHANAILAAARAGILALGAPKRYAMISFGCDEARIIAHYDKPRALKLFRIALRDLAYVDDTAPYEEAMCKDAAADVMLTRSASHEALPLAEAASQAFDRMLGTDAPRAIAARTRLDKLRAR